MPASGESAGKYPFASGSARVRFRSEMVARLKRSVLRSAPPGGNAEIGGVLLGQTIHDADGSTVLDISDFMILPTAPGAGNEYQAPVEEVRRLLEASNVGRGGRAIGYFRTQDDPDFRLRPHEAALAEEVLENSCVVLLLHPLGGDRVLAGLIQSAGAPLRRIPAKLFQFDEAGLGAVHPIPMRPSGSANPNLANRAHFDRAKTQLLRAGVVALAALCAGALAAYWLGGRSAPSRTEAARGGQAGAQPGAPAIQSIAPGPAPSSGLEISVNRATGGVMVGWNSARALHATTGQLVITDGNAPSEIVPLGAHELQQGKIFYRSRSERLRFRVELADLMGRRYSDSVLVLGGSPGVEPSQGIAQRAAAPQVQPSANREAPAPAASEPAPVRTFQPPPQQHPQPGERVISLDAPTPIHVGAPIPMEVAQTVLTPSIPAPLAESRTSRSPTAASPGDGGAATAPAAESLRSGPDKPSGTRQYVAPVALLQVTPRLDSVIRSVLVNDVEVEIKLQIDASGRVLQAQPLHTDTGLHEHIERAAIEAAMRWRFKPASIDGTPVPSVTVVKFVFRR